MRIHRGSRKRKAVASIISALILFSLIFTVGASFFLNVSKLQQTEVGAYDNRLSLQDQARQESLSLKAGLGTDGNLWLMVNNTGGTPSTVSSIYVTDTTGEVVSNASSGETQFLTAPPDLNESLPLTLNIGASTAQVGGNIEINQSAYEFVPGEQSVFINVLTSLGNVFSVSYPTVNALTFKNIIVNQNVIDEILTNEVDQDVNQNNYVAGCEGCVSNVYAGGDILVTLITATPSPVLQGATITVKATVWDYSVYSAASVYVTLRSVYSGTASVTPDISKASSKCGTTVSSISSLSYATFTCTFSANTGSSGGGTVTFAGEASGCMQTPTTSSPCTSGTLATSSTSSSNPVQVGSSVSLGGWSPNFYYYDYTASGQTTPGQLGVISHSTEYVAVYVKVTNTYNNPLTILEGSYIQAVSPGVDFDLFLGKGPVKYSSSPPTFTAYGCVESPPSAPVDTVSGQTCITVNPGQSVTLMFIASSPGSTSWDWGTSYPGGSGGYPGGTNAQIILEYVANNGGTYTSATQDIPFEGLYVT